MHGQCWKVIQCESYQFEFLTYPHKQAYMYSVAQAHLYICKYANTVFITVCMKYKELDYCHPGNLCLCLLASC